MVSQRERWLWAKGGPWVGGWQGCGSIHLNTDPDQEGKMIADFCESGFGAQSNQIYFTTIIQPLRFAEGQNSDHDTQPWGWGCEEKRIRVLTGRSSSKSLGGVGWGGVGWVGGWVGAWVVGGGWVGGGGRVGE